MDELVENVARALCLAGRPDYDHGDVDFLWTAYEDDAHAVIPLIYNAAIEDAAEMAEDYDDYAVVRSIRALKRP